MSELLGVVMCGGESKRMGTDKGLIKEGNFTWAELAFQKLSAFQLQVVVSVNETQGESYTQFFPKNQLIIDSVEAVKGPLRGLLSIHQHYPDKDLLVLACDLKNMTADALKLLVSLYEANKNDYIVYKSRAGIEPLCGIYRKERLKFLSANPPTHFGLQRLIGEGDAFFVKTDSTGDFENFNSIEK